MSMPRYSTLYQLNTRIHLNHLSRSLGRPVILDDLPDDELDRLAELGFDWLYLLGVWQVGPQSRQVARQHPGLQVEYRRALPDVSEADICGSCFAVAEYSVAEELGGDEAMLRLRERCQRRGLRVMLDFIPNHTGLDHRWVQTHPEYYLWGSEGDLQAQPQNFVRIASSGKPLILAHGRDPYFDGWSDTLQLDYANPSLQAAMRDELMRVAGLCDGVRCDMAMLILPEVFQHTWGRQATPFWPGAIQEVRQRYPNFSFLAEVYWDLEATLQAQGFDFCYDKRLYDRLLTGEALPVRQHLTAPLAYQDKLARFLENHDEKRAAEVFYQAQHQAAAVLTYTVPGLRFFHEGQLQGRRIRLPVQLCRAPEQAVDAELEAFYGRLLDLLHQPTLRDGQWQLLESMPARGEDTTWQNCIAFCWEQPMNEVIRTGARVVVVVNYAPAPGHVIVRLPWSDLAGHTWQLSEVFSQVVRYEEGSIFADSGFAQNLPPWGVKGFIIEPVLGESGTG